MKTFFGSIIFVLIIAVCLLLLIVFSNTGLRVAVKLASHYSDYSISYQKIRGNISGPIRIEDLKACNPRVCVEADRLYIAWQPTQLFLRHVVIDRMSANHLTVSQLAPLSIAHSQSTSSSKLSSGKQMRVSLRQLEVAKLTIKTNSDRQYVLNDIAMQSVLRANKVFLSAAGQLRQPVASRFDALVKGTPDNYQINLGIIGQDSDITWQGDGNQNGFTLSTKHHTLAHGQLNSTLSLLWKPQLTWSLNLNASQINLREWNPLWPQSLELSIHSDGQLKQHQPDFNVAINSKTTNSRLQLNAKVNQKINANWQFNGQKLSEILPFLNGDLSTTGKITGSLKKPLINTMINSNQLSYKNYSLKGLASSFLIDTSQQKDSTVDLDVKQLNLYQQKMSNLHLNGHGVLNQYHMTLKFNHALAAVSTALHGSYQKSFITNTIESMELVTRTLGTWQLTQPTDIKTSMQSIESTPICLRVNQSTPNHTCTQLSWNRDQSWTSSLSSHGINLSLLNQYTISEQFGLSGLLNVDLKASGQHKKVNAAQLDASIESGQMTVVGKSSNQYIPINSANFQATLKKGALSSQLKIITQKNNHVDVQLSSNDFDPFQIDLAQQNVDGSIDINANHLQNYTALIPNVNIKNGSLTSSLAIHGNIKAPNLSGETKLSDIQLFLPSIGLLISDLDFNVVSQGNTTHFDGSLYSNKSPLHFNGETKIINQSWSSRINLIGNNFQLMNSDEYKVSISPKLQVEINNKNINVTGDVVIPHAKITPYRGKNVVTLPHNDIQYKQDNDTNPWTLQGNVHASLGNDVNLKIIGIHGKATGQLKISKKPQASTLCNGHILIKGKYQAYGHKLIIAPQSMLLYNNNLITNPLLNLRATKVISNNNQLFQQDFSANDVTVGIEVTGPLDRPTLGLFSIPANLSKADILSYLILGHLSTNPNPTNPSQQNANSTTNIFDTLKLSETGLANSGSGGLSNTIQSKLGLSELGIETNSTRDVAGNQLSQQNYFVLGKYLSSKLYLRYSQGLVDSDDLIQLRYFITPRWIIQTQLDSLDNSNGIDILYSIER